MAAQLFFIFCCWVLVNVAAFEVDPADGRTIIPIGGFFPMDGTWPAGVYAQPMVDIALQHVNANLTLFPTFKLAMTWNNTHCTPQTAIAVANWQFSAIPDMVGIIGEGCSVGSEPIALLGSVYKMPQVSWGSTSPDLSDGSLYPYFLRVCGSDDNQALAWLAIARHYGWKRVATINSQENLHAELTAKFLRAAQAEGIEVAVSESFPGSQNNSMTLIVDGVAAQGVPIVFLAAYTEDAANILTAAKNNSVLSRPEVVFIGTDAWMQPSFVDISNGHAVGFIGSSTAPGDSAFRTQVYEEYTAKTGYDADTASLSYADYGYDAVLTYAYALNQLLVVEEYDLTESNVLDFRLALYNQMLNNTFFTGLTKGTVTFDSYGDRTTTYGIYNVQPDGFVLVAEWNPLDDNWTQIDDIVWPDGTGNVPSDAFPVTFVYIGDGVRIAFIVIAALCAVVPVTFMIALIINWSHPVMIAATPAFMFMILFGTLMGIGVVWVIAVVPTDATCVIPIWMGHIAFWIVFSCLFVKTFRVWWIFRRGDKLTTTVITNNQITGIAIFIVLAVSVYLAVWTGCDRPIAVAIPDLVEPELIHIWQCQGSNTWDIVLYAVELAFLACGCVLAYKINKVKILKKNMLRFNESSHIAVCIFCLIFVGLVIVPSIEWLSESNDTKFILECVGLLVIAMVINIVLFVPKFYAIWTNKSASSGGSTTGSSTIRSNKGASKKPNSHSVSDSTV